MAAHAMGLRDLMERAGYGSQAALARDVGVSCATVSAWNTGRSLPSEGSLARLAGALGVSGAEVVAALPAHPASARDIGWRADADAILSGAQPFMVGRAGSRAVGSTVMVGRRGRYREFEVTCEREVVGGWSAFGLREVGEGDCSDFVRALARLAAMAADWGSGCDS